MSVDRGYFETQGDRKRLRLVKEGYNARDPSVPFDAVLFDSDSDGMGAYLDSGIYKVPPLSGLRYSAGTTGAWVTTWDLPFVPLCVFTMSVSLTSGMWSTRVDPQMQSGTQSINRPQIRVSTSGIWLRGRFSATEGGDCFLKWVAFRVPAT